MDARARMEHLAMTYNNMAAVWWPVPEGYKWTPGSKPRLPFGCERFDRVYGRARNTCSVCGSRDLHVENYSMMWHDGDVVCHNGHLVRMYDAG